MRVSLIWFVVKVAVFGCITGLSAALAASYSMSIPEACLLSVSVGYVVGMVVVVLEEEVNEAIR